MSPIILLVGLGVAKDLTWKDLRLAVGAAVRRGQDQGAKTVALISGGNIANDHIAEDSHPRHRGRNRTLETGDSTSTRSLRQKIEAARFGDDLLHYELRKKAADRVIKRFEEIATCTNLARRWGTEPANVVTTEYLAREARKLGARGVKVTVLERAQMEKLGLNLLLAVSKGSAMPPKLIIMDWNPRGAKTTYAFVGKGLVFDSGGLTSRSLRWKR